MHFLLLHLFYSLDSKVDEFMSSALQRSLQYERKLSSLGERSRRARNRNGQKRRPPDGSTESPSCGSLVQGMVEETSNSTSASTEPPKSEAGTDSRASRREDTPSDYSRGRRPTPTSEAGQREESVGGPGSSRTKPRTSPTITTPPPQLQVPRYKVVELLEKGYSMRYINNNLIPWIIFSSLAFLLSGVCHATLSILEYSPHCGQ